LSTLFPVTSAIIIDKIPPILAVFEDYPMDHQREKDLLVALLGSLGGPASAGSGAETEAIDWEWLLNYSVAHNIAPLLCHQILQHQGNFELLAEVTDKMSRVLANAQVRNSKVMQEAGEILAIFQENGIPAVILKGPALGLLYPEPYLREYTDLDLLIAEESVKKAQDILTRRNYPALDCDSRTGQFEIPTRMGIRADDSFGTHWKTHFKLDPETQQVATSSLAIEIHSPRHWGRGSHGLIDVEEWLLRARPSQVCGSPAPLLAPEDWLGYLCCHLYADHVWGRMTGLRNVLDIYLLIKQGIDWEVFSADFDRFHSAQQEITDWFEKQMALSCEANGDNISWFDGYDFISSVNYGLCCVDELFGPIVPSSILELTSPQEENRARLLAFPPEHFFVWQNTLKNRLLDCPGIPKSRLVIKGLIKFWKKIPPFSSFSYNSRNISIWRDAPRVKPAQASAAESLLY
jgi:hypothetical protein